MDPISSEPNEERKDNMSSLAAGFIVRMCKWATSALGETTPNSKEPCSKSSKRSSLDEESHKSVVVITMDSLK